MKDSQNLSFSIMLIARATTKLLTGAGMSKRPTVSDLASAAGVSVATVDRVLNQRHPVREGTADRVLRAAEAIGYHATSLLKQRLRVDAPAADAGIPAAEARRLLSIACRGPAGGDARSDQRSRQGDRRIRQRIVAGDDRRALASAWRAGRRGRHRLGRSPLCFAGDRSSCARAACRASPSFPISPPKRAPASSDATIARKGAPPPG